MNKIKHKNGQMKIGYIEPTLDKLTARSGLFFLNNFLESTNILSQLDYHFHSIKHSKKGLTVKNFFKQLIAFFIDGTKTNLTHFDDLKKDKSYAKLLNLKQEELASSHQIKRMFEKFEDVNLFENVLRNILHRIFLANLCSTKPEQIELGIDTTVLNNDDSNLKEGVTPTYKNVKGFQPLLVYWNGMVIDVIFREGKCHSNHSDDVIQTLKAIVTTIREKYQKDIPIIVKMDSGFLSEKNFRSFEEDLKIHYVCVGKMYDSIKKTLTKIPASNRKVFQGKHTWEYVEFGNKLQRWKKFRRTIYVQQVSTKTEQLVFDFACSDRIIYTNLGTQECLDSSLRKLDKEKYFTPEYIIEMHHSRAIDELINRYLKEFMTTEKLPFKSFYKNMLFFYMQVISYMIMKNFQRHISFDVLNPNLTPNNFRRRFIDQAGKIVSHSRKMSLKIPEEIYNNLKISVIFERIKQDLFKVYG